MPEILAFDDAAALFVKGAAMFAQAAADSLRERGAFSVALAGGSTPKGLYALMADDPQLRQMIPWPQIDFFWGDERHVPPDHPDSNYRMAQEAMLAKVPVTPERVHRVRAELPDAPAAAAMYDAEVRASIGSGTTVPRLDLVLLGMGTDGHTASLFPGTLALSERSHLVVANWVERMHAYRITMTLPLLNAARRVLVLAAGADKASRVRDALQPPPDAPPLPIQLVRPDDGRTTWLLDRDAARLLKTIPE
jgi:6-phosphogluconolactonase